jgi:hypothetical protein
MKKVIISILLSISNFVLFAQEEVQRKDLSLWYIAPAKLVGSPQGSAMNETLPIGNGRIGGLIFGETSRERVVLNENSLWTGNEHVQGAYQVLSNLYIDLPGHQQISNYRRDLDLAQSVAHVRYTVGQTTYSREYFASYPDQVLVIRLSADQKGKYSGHIDLEDGHLAQTFVKAHSLSAEGDLGNGLKYKTEIAVLNNGGKLQQHHADYWCRYKLHLRFQKELPGGGTNGTRCRYGGKSCRQIIRHFKGRTHSGLPVHF